MQDSDKPVDRETLYNEIWTEPVTVVARRYGLSDVGLAKICRNLSIPRPQRGHWAKLKAGKAVMRPPLPNLKQSPSALGSLVRLPTEKIALRDKTKVAASHAREEALTALPTQDASIQHPLVVAASKRLHQSKGWPETALLRSAPKEVLNISVTKDTLDRALALADTLLKILGNQGFEFAVDREKGVTWMKFLDTGSKLSFLIVEQVKRSPHQITAAEERARKRYWDRNAWDTSISYPSIPQFDYFATGNLTIQVGGWPSRSWNDTPRTRLENRMPEIVGGILTLTHEMHAKEQEQRRREEAHRIAVDRYEFLTQRRTDEKERFEKLEATATDWERATKLRAYANATEANATTCGEITSEQAEWLAWVRAKADWLDPLIQVSDPILDAPEPKRPGYW